MTRPDLNQLDAADTTAIKDALTQQASVLEQGIRQIHDPEMKTAMREQMHRFDRLAGIFADAAYYDMEGVA